MDLIRKVLIFSKNSSWSHELKSEMAGVSKLKPYIASTRADAVKLITEHRMTALVVENSLAAKDLGLVLRSILSQRDAVPKYIFLFSSNFAYFQNLIIPEELLDIMRGYSLPLTKDEIVGIVTKNLLVEKDGSAFDMEFAKVLMQGTQKVFGVMGDAFGEIQMGKPYILKDDILSNEISIRGKIIIKTEFFSGSFFISFPEKTYLNIYEKYTGEKHSKLSNDNSDFAGELANMIYGQAKAIVGEQGYNLEMVIPISDESDKLVSRNPIYVVPYECSAGKFYIKLASGFF